MLYCIVALYHEVILAMISLASFVFLKLWYWSKDWFDEAEWSCTFSMGLDGMATLYAELISVCAGKISMNIWVRASVWSLWVYAPDRISILIRCLWFCLPLAVAHCIIASLSVSLCLSICLSLWLCLPSLTLSPSVPLSLSFRVSCFLSVDLSLCVYVSDSRCLSMYLSPTLLSASLAAAISPTAY